MVFDGLPQGRVENADVEFGELLSSRMAVHDIVPNAFELAKSVPNRECRSARFISRVRHSFASRREEAW
jgi:hypothetical protein